MPEKPSYQGEISQGTNPNLLTKVRSNYITSNFARSPMAEALRSWMPGFEYYEKVFTGQPVEEGEQISLLLPIVDEAWWGMEYLAKGHFGNGMKANVGKYLKETEAEARRVFSNYKSKMIEDLPEAVPTVAKSLTSLDKFIQKASRERNDIVRFWNGEKYSSWEQLQRAGGKDLDDFIKWLEKQSK